VFLENGGLWESGEYKLHRHSDRSRVNKQIPHIRLSLKIERLLESGVSIEQEVFTTLVNIVEWGKGYGL